MTEHTMDEFFVVLEACGARRVTRQEELEPLRSAWSDHCRFKPKAPPTCFGCDQRVERPYAIWNGQTSYCWCINCAPLMPVFSAEVRGRGGDPVIGMRNFAGVIVCARVGAPSPGDQ